MAVISVFLVAVVCLTSSVYATKGVIQLDSLTFDKIVGKFDATLVKIDVQYPYGEQHDEFGLLSKELVKTSDLLIAEVGVQDYGENENKDLADRFGAKKDDFPVLLLFKGQNPEPIKFPAAETFKSDRIKAFLRQNTGIKLLLANCLEQFDRLAEQFVALSAKEQQGQVLEQTRSEASKLESDEDKKSADIYVKLMSKVIERGLKFIDSENERVKNLLAGKITDAKRKELQMRVNILQSFLQMSNSGDSSKTEL